MRAKRAKKLKYTVLAELYGLEISDANRRAILASKKFKNIYRNRKRHYLKTKSMKVGIS